MLTVVYKIRHFFERHGFYVSSRLADRLGMRAKSVRLFFIYVSFATLGVGFAIWEVINSDSLTTTMIQANGI